LLPISDPFDKIKVVAQLQGAQNTMKNYNLEMSGYGPKYFTKIHSRQMKRMLMTIKKHCFFKINPDAFTPFNIQTK